MTPRGLPLVGVMAALLAAGCSAAAPAPAETAAAASSVTPQKGGAEEFGPYEVVENWPQLLPGSEGYTWGSTPSIFAESPDRVWIVQRGELPLKDKLQRGQPVWTLGLRASDQEHRKTNQLFVVDGNGKLIRSYTEFDHLFSRAHTVSISPYDPDKHVWVVDDYMHAVYKFTQDGKLVMTLGEPTKAGEDDKHFNRPTGLAWLPNGSFLVSDGYLNTRVVKFDKNGKFVMSFGMRGVNPPYQEDPEEETRPGFMNSVHSVAVGPNGRVYVADRENHRIQVFDQDGTFLDQWPIKTPYFILPTQDGIVVSSGAYEKVVKYELDGTFVYSWGTSGVQAPLPGGFFGIHGMSVDSAGNFYVAESTNGRAQKFRPKPGADPRKLVGLPIQAVR